MRRTIYINDVQIDEFMLNNTERSKIAEILAHHNTLGSEGIISGLDISINPGNNLAIDVSLGSAVLPNREIISLEESQSNITLVSNVLGSVNLVLLSYLETYSIPKPNQEGNKNFFSYAKSSGYIDVKSAQEFLSLPETSEDPNNQTLENSLIIGIVFGNGENTPLLSSSIIQPSEDSNITNFDKFRLVNGIVVKSTNISSTSLVGTLKYDLVNRRVRFVSPNNTSPPELNELGEGFLTIENDLTNQTLSDPDVPEDFIIVDIFNPIHPATELSIDSSLMPGLIQNDILVPIFANPTVNIDLDTLTANQLEELIDTNAFSNFIINETITFSDVYVQNLTRVTDGVDLATTRASAEDKIHREIVGTGQPRSGNPHGLSLDNIIQLFDAFQGAIDIGSALNKAAVDALSPRFTAPASSRSRYTLLFETDYVGTSDFYPFRVYINSPGPDNDQFAGLTVSINAKYSPETNNWDKDDTLTQAVRMRVSFNNFDIHVSNDLTITDDDWGDSDLDIQETFARFLNPVGIVPKTNEEHNIADLYSALMNVTSIANVDRPNKILIFENNVSSLGDLRIYFGPDQALRPFIIEEETGELDEDGDPITEEISYATDSIDFVINAKPVLGGTGWTKDSGLPSYLFRYRFSDATLNAYRYINLSALTFDDEEWENVKIAIDGGIRATENSVITGNFVITSDGVNYNSSQIRKKLVSLREIGWNISFGTTIPGGSAAYPAIDDPTIFDSDYLDWPDTDFGVMDFGTPLRVFYANRGRNSTATNTPKYVWTGPKRPILRGRRPNAGLDPDGDTLIVGFANYIGGRHRFLIPLQFEEELVEVFDIKIPIDLSGIDYTLPIYGFPQSLEFGGTQSDTEWYSLNFWDTNPITGSANLISPPNDGSVLVTHERIPGSSDSYMIHIRSATPNQSFITFNKDTSVNGELSVVYIHLTSDRSTIASFSGSSWQSQIPGTVYNYWHLGNPIIRYRTTNIE